MLPRSAISLFCDDIREEKSGKDTFVGVYPDNVNVPSFPFTFSRIAIYTRIIIDIKDSPGDIPISILVPTEDDVLLGTLDKKKITKAKKEAKKNKSPTVGLIVKVTAAPFRVPAPGLIKIIVVIEGQEYVGGVLNIQSIP